MRHLFTGVFILLGAVVIGGCSNDDLNINFDDENAIDFSVTVPRSPRTATTTESINEFSVWAFVDGNKFMSQKKQELAGFAHDVLAGRRQGGEFL